MKLSTVLDYHKDGSTNIRGYRIALKKTEIEKYNLQDKEFDIEFSENQIVIKVKESV